MIVAVLQFELFIRGSESLKDKRRVVRSLKDRLHHDHQVSVAEVGALDELRRAEMALSLVSSDVAYAGGVLDRIVAALREHREAELGRVARVVLDRSNMPPTDLDEEGHPAWGESDTSEMVRGLDRIERELDGGAA